MKAFTTMSFFAVLVTVLFGVAGCKKIHDYPHTSSPCQIAKMKGKLTVGEDSLIFKYNNKGLPVSITRIQASTGSPNFLFRYDKRDRLKDFVGIYSDDITYEFWHRYGHDHKNRIVTDTFYVMGVLTNDPEGYIEYTVVYGYDAQNRINKGTITYTHNQEVVSWEYFYDQQGNRQLGGDWPVVTYDNKVNLHRLHPVWQFLTQDYSNNNRITADAYNEYGLPLKYNIGGTDFDKYFPFLTLYFLNVDITYSCR